MNYYITVTVLVDKGTVEDPLASSNFNKKYSGTLGEPETKPNQTKPHNRREHTKKTEPNRAI